jgi:hypothetical protein
MTTIDDLELPIQKTKIDGPAVRGLETRKEDNNNQQATVTKFLQTYNEVKSKILGGLRNLGALTY